MAFGGTLAAVLVAVACFVQARHSATRTGRLILPGSSRATSAPAVPGAVADPVAPRRDVDQTPPVRLGVPAIDLSAAVVSAGLTPDGPLAVPPASPVGGELGPAALLGHVDSRSGPDVLHRLTALHVGDAVLVRHADGSLTHLPNSAVTVTPKLRTHTAPGQDIRAAPIRA